MSDHGPAGRRYTGPARAATAIGGALRAFGATARGMALDSASGISRVGEAVAGRAAGSSPGPATLPVRVLILSDERGRAVTGADTLRPALRRANEIFTAGAGLRIRIAAIETVSDRAPAHALDPRANQRLLLDDVLGRTAFLRERLPRRPLLSVVGDPVTVVVVRSIAGRATGCSLGMTADWVICQASLFDRRQRNRYDETVLAHELGHALNLPHRRDRANLMYPASSPPDDVRGTALQPWQAAILHANRHVIPPARRNPATGSVG